MLKVFYIVELRDTVDPNWRVCHGYDGNGVGKMSRHWDNMIQALDCEKAIERYQDKGRFYRPHLNLETRIVQVKQLTATLKVVVKGK